MISATYAKMRSEIAKSRAETEAKIAQMEEDVKKADREGWDNICKSYATALHKVREALEFGIEKINKFSQTALMKIEAFDCQATSG